MIPFNTEGGRGQQVIHDEPIDNALIQGVLVKMREAGVMSADIIIPQSRLPECRARLDVHGFEISGTLNLLVDREFVQFIRMRHIPLVEQTVNQTVWVPTSDFERQALANAPKLKVY